ncbi:MULTISPECIES: hypothetical protein [Photorhabdus]|nr:MULTISPECIES: hypothetical protein [Photorhabdus]MCZ1250681.1 hypothetical protein [Photorhabdus laumondii subsp. laumondii]NDL49642.1 hypothetical protein [Photorhabdus laumondii subsp. laumondii]
MHRGGKGANPREQIPGSIENDVTGGSECSQQRGNLKDDGYILIAINEPFHVIFITFFYVHMINIMILWS